MAAAPTVMRVIAGSLGGRRLIAVPGSSTRPTAERVREALFSRLQSRYDLTGIDVLDLFAGTGALGIEALSRGARSLVSVERNRKAARVLVENLKACGLEGTAELIVEDVAAALARIGRGGRRFEGIFVDPPYGRDIGAEVLETLARSELLAAACWVSVEGARDDPLPASAGPLVRVREDVYGDTRISLYEVRQVSEDLDQEQP